MDDKIRLCALPADGKAGSKDALFSAEQAAKVRAFHKGLKEYQPTPLRRLDALAQALGVGGIYVKDESYRFGLNAFKALGGSYALGCILAEKTGRPVGDVSGIAPESYTFVTATDGNHGRGVAWAAQRLGQRAVVYMPKGTAPERLQNIRALGAQAQITDLIYDDAVRFARRQAEANGWTLVQDTSWPGYEETPTRIMQGYLTMADEAAEQLAGQRPTHIFLQAGVGAMAGAVAGYFADRYRDAVPVIAVVEPNDADCLFRTAQANDGQLHKTQGNLRSMMAGLCCGEVCPIAWEVLKHHACCFFACPDSVAADGMRVLGNPLGGDARIVSGESGASTSGLVYRLLTDAALRPYKEQLGLDENSVVLCFSTEGDTDRANYRHIVWDGWCTKA